MSLIHEALKEMEPGPVARPSQLARPQTASHAARWPALAAFFGVLALGALGVLAWQHLRPLGAPVTVASASAPLPAVAAPAATAVPPAPSEPPAAPADAAAGRPGASSEDAALAAAPTAKPASSAAPAVVAPSTVIAGGDAARPAAPSAADGQPSAARSPASPRSAAAARTARHATPAPATPTEPAEDMPAEKRFALFLQAMKTSDLPGAQTQLQHLRRQMTGNSMTLLRAEAWFALASGDTAGARARYTSLLERLPGDEEASINLASLELREQHVEPARRLLHEALTQNPDSEAVKAALARFRDVRN